jgi:hypothetical protein
MHRWMRRIFYPEREIKFSNIRQPMLKLKAHSGFHDLFLKYILQTNTLDFNLWQLLINSVTGFIQVVNYRWHDIHKHIMVSMIYFDSDMSKSTNTVVYFDWKTVIYIYACGKCRTQFMLPMEKSVTFTVKGHLMTYKQV